MKNFRLILASLFAIFAAFFAQACVITVSFKNEIHHGQLYRVIRASIEGSPITLDSNLRKNNAIEFSQKITSEQIGTCALLINAMIFACKAHGKSPFAHNYYIKEGQFITQDEAMKSK